MFAIDTIGFVCFYHAERVLSAIAKFLVHLLGEEEGRSEMGVGGGRGREWGEKMDNLWRCGKWQCTKNSPERQQIWHLGTPTGGYRRVIHFYKALFRDISIAYTLCSEKKHPLFSRITFRKSN